MYSFSKYYKKINIDDKNIAIFNSLIREIYFCDKETLSKIESGKISSKYKRKLKEAGIIIQSNKDDEILLSEFRSAFEKEHTNINLVYIIPSLICNLQCDYCYVYQNDKNSKHISKKNYMNTDIIDCFLDKYILYLKERRIKSATIQFYGGEPCCNWNIIEYCVSKAKQKFPFTFVIITNGTLLDDNKIQFIKKNNIGLGVSLDGTKEMTDLHRKFVGSEKSVFDEVILNIRKIKKAGIKLALSVTITEDFLLYQNEILDFFEKIEIQNINYNLLHFHKSAINLDKYYEKATIFLIHSFERLGKKGIMDDRIIRKIDAFSSDIFYYGDCGVVYANQIVIKPNGAISVCQGECLSDNHEIGNILTTDFNSIVQNKERLEWKNNATIYNQYCLECEAVSICGGGCCLQAKEIENSNNIDYGFCIHTKKLFFWLIQKLFMME